MNDNHTLSFLGRTLTPNDSKAMRRLGLEWTAVEIREGGKRPDWTIPLAILSAIFPAPMNPNLYASIEMGRTSIDSDQKLFSGHRLRLSKSTVTAQPRNPILKDTNSLFFLFFVWIFLFSLYFCICYFIWWVFSVKLHF